MLAQIQLAGKTSGLKFVQAMKSAIAVIHKVEQHKNLLITTLFSYSAATFFYSLARRMWPTLVKKSISQ